MMKGMRITDIIVFEKLSELKKVNAFIDKRIKFHKGAANLIEEQNEALTQEAAQHLLVCIELYEIKGFIYSNIAEIANDIKIEEDEQNS